MGSAARAHLKKFRGRIRRDPTPGAKIRGASVSQSPLANLCGDFRRVLFLLRGFLQGPQDRLLQVILSSEQLPYLHALVSGESGGGANVKRTGETSDP